MPFLHALEPALLCRGEALSLHRVDVDDDRPLGAQGVPDRATQRAHVVAVDHADVREVQLLEQQPGRRVGLDRRLDLRAEPLDPLAHERQPGQALLDPLTCVVEARVEAEALEVACESADVRRDRHPIVVEDDDDRSLEPAGVMERLIGDAAGQRPVADHGDDVAVLADPLAHRLLEADGVADRGRGVAGAHDVVLGLLDRAEGREALVLADRGQLVAAAGEDLVRVGLVADVPEDLVARRVEQRVQRDRQLARAEVRAEVTADLADGVDQPRAHFLRQHRELLLGEAMQVLGSVDPVEQPRRGRAGVLLGALAGSGLRRRLAAHEVLV